MRRNLTSRLPILAAVAAVGVGSVAARADLTNFTPGDLVVLDGTSQAEDSGTVPAVLLEYTPTGTLVGQLTVPSSPSGSNNALTLMNATNTSHEGVLTLSENGQWLTFAGYDAAAGSTAGTNDATGTVAEINLFAPTLSVNTTTTIANSTGANGTNVRAATTIDGNEFYVAQSHAASSGLPGGLTYISGTGASATPTSLGDTLDPRSVIVLGGANPSTGVLVAGSGSSSFGAYGGTGHGVYGLTAGGGSGLPTTTPIAGSQINNDASDGCDEAFTNEPGDSNSYHGYNTLYLAANTSAIAGFIEKYQYNGTEFVEVQQVNTAGTILPIGITTQLDPTTGNEDIFYTEPTGIYELNTLDNATDGFISTTSTLVTSAPADSAFYGIANVPEPASAGLIGVGALGLLARRRNRKA